jgi:hypothetical protein
VTLNDMVESIAAATDFPRGRVYMHARRLQEAGVIPVGAGGRNAPECDTGHVVLVLMSLLSGKPLHHATKAAAMYAGLTNDGTDALGYLAAMLNSVSRVEHLDLDNVPETLLLAFKSTISVVGGEQPAVVVRYSCIDDPMEVAFTQDGAPYEPELIETITESRTIPGVFMFRLGRALREASH